MNPLRILIIATDPLARTGLAALLATQDNCLIVGQVGEVTDWDDTLDLFRPDVALWDLGWALDEGLDVETLTNNGLPLVVLLPNEDHLAKLLSTDVGGILLRENSADQLAVALTAVRHNLRVLDPNFEIAPPAERAAPLPAAPLEPPEPLTPRELEVLTLLAEGLTNKAIGQVLEISPHTVKFHVSAIISKLGGQSRTEAVMLATRMGLLPL